MSWLIRLFLRSFRASRVEHLRESALGAGKYAEVRAGAEAVKPSPLAQKGMEVCT